MHRVFEVFNKLIVYYLLFNIKLKELKRKKET